MPTVTLVNKQRHRNYTVNGPVYESPGVWCGTATDAEFGECFVKIIHYGNMPTPQQQQLSLGWAKDEAQTMLKAAKCTDRVPQLYDHWQDTANKSYVLVMQKMRGKSLRQWMDERPLPQPIDEKTAFVRLQIVRQTAEILSTIHNRIPSFVHRDIKPENLVIRLDENKRWQVSLIDFGTARMHFVHGVGTRYYQAPEQKTAQGTVAHVDETIDVFALGILLYELITGENADDIDYAFLPSHQDAEWRERPTMPKEVTDTAIGRNVGYLFTKMTEYRPEKRLRLSEVVREIPARRKYR